MALLGSDCCVDACSIFLYHNVTASLIGASIESFNLERIPTFGGEQAGTSELVH